MAETKKTTVTKEKATEQGAKCSATEQGAKFSKAGLIASGEFKAVEQDILAAILPDEQKTVKEAKDILNKYKKGEVK